MMLRRQFTRLAGSGAAMFAVPHLIRPALSAAAEGGFIYLGPVGDFGWTYRMTLRVKRLSKNSATRSRQPLWRMWPKDLILRKC